MIDSAGGTSASANHVVTACVGSEIAGAAASASYRIESGCGPTSLSLASDLPYVGPPDSARQIPATSDLGLVLLAIALATLAARRLRVPRR